MTRPINETFPILGYVIINAVVIVLTLAAWYAAKSGLFFLPTATGAGRPGVAALLVFVPLCFLLATAFDIAWRALGRAHDAPRGTHDPPQRKETPSRDMPSKETEKA